MVALITFSGYLVIFHKNLTAGNPDALAPWVVELC